MVFIFRTAGTYREGPQQSEDCGSVKFTFWCKFKCNFPIVVILKRLVQRYSKDDMQIMLLYWVSENTPQHLKRGFLIYVFTEHCISSFDNRLDTWELCGRGGGLTVCPTSVKWCNITEMQNQGHSWILNITLLCLRKCIYIFSHQNISDFVIENLTVCDTMSCDFLRTFGLLFWCS